jgi:ribonucleotide reductase alpha subunit
MAKDLRGKRCMPHIKSNNIDYNERYVKYGFIQGDGQTQRLNSQHHQGMEVNIGKNDKDIMDLFSNENFKLNHSGRSIYLKEFKDDMNKLGFSTNSLPTRDFPTEFNNFTYIEKISFLKGLFSANGCVVAHHRVQFKSTCYELILNLKDALDDLGIHSNITTNKPTEVKFENGTYLCKQSYDLAINRYDSIVKFYDLIGFVHNYKNEKLKNLIIEKSPVITSIQYLDKQKVYDFTENITHWGVVNGYIVHNCAEEPLPKGGSCLLGSINLSEFIKHKTHPYFDFNEFEKAVKIAVKGLNDVLDEGLLLHPLKEQQDSVHDWRQIGLGIMGLADMLIKVGMVYGSDESIELCETIGRVMINSAVQASSELANAKGSFVKYNCHDFMKSDFVKSNLTQQTLDKVRTCGLRNSQLLTAAPTGTISTMLGISGGIEPVFANYYTRKTESLHGKDKYYKIFTTIAWDYLQKHDLGEDETKLPKQFITSSEIPYINRIKMQAIWQHYIDASISSTVNLPNEATIEDIENLYLNAWKNGLKGITVYRAGCKREGILVTNDDKNDIDKNAPTQELERGTIIEADDNVVGLKRKLTTGCGSLHCTAFFDPISGDLMETYLSKGSSGGCHNFMVGLSRMMSLAARGGVDIQEICDQLDSCGVCPSYATRRATKGDTSKGACCPMAIGNALRDMYDEMQDRVGNYDYEYDEPIEEPNPTIIYKDESTAKCPECGEPMRHEGGCDVCSACGYSHCD